MCSRRLVRAWAHPARTGTTLRSRPLRTWCTLGCRSGSSISCTAARARPASSHATKSEMDQRYQVIVVGGGPVGVALAVELGLRGVSCAVVERRQTPQRIPKGQSLTQRTLEHFYFWGIADELRAARLLPPGYPIGSITTYGSLMGDYSFGPDTRER